jgi:hypothetical protein
MEALVLKIGMILIGLIVINFLLGRFSQKQATDNTFIKEYLDVLNNPIYKIKKE